MRRKSNLWFDIPFVQSQMRIKFALYAFPISALADFVTQHRKRARQDTYLKSEHQVDPFQVLQKKFNSVSEFMPSYKHTVK